MPKGITLVLFSLCFATNTPQVWVDEDSPKSALRVGNHLLVRLLHLLQRVLAVDQRTHQLRQRQRQRVHPLQRLFALLARLVEQIHSRHGRGLRDEHSGLDLDAASAANDDDLAALVDHVLSVTPLPRTHQVLVQVHIGEHLVYHIGSLSVVDSLHFLDVVGVRSVEHPVHAELLQIRLGLLRGATGCNADVLVRLHGLLHAQQDLHQARSHASRCPMDKHAAVANLLGALDRTTRSSPHTARTIGR